MNSPFSEELTARVLAVADALYDRMIDQQRAKVIRLAREAIPHLSS